MKTKSQSPFPSRLCALCASVALAGATHHANAQSQSPNEAPRVAIDGRMTTEGFRLSVESPHTGDHVIEISLDMELWDELGKATPLGDGLFEYLDEEADGDGSRFYRCVCDDQDPEGGGGNIDDDETETTTEVKDGKTIVTETKDGKLVSRTVTDNATGDETVTEYEDGEVVAETVTDKRTGKETVTEYEDGEIVRTEVSDPATNTKTTTIYDHEDYDEIVITDDANGTTTVYYVRDSRTGLLVEVGRSVMVGLANGGTRTTEFDAEGNKVSEQESSPPGPKGPPTWIRTTYFEIPSGEVAQVKVLELKDGKGIKETDTYYDTFNGNRIQEYITEFWDGTHGPVKKRTCRMFDPATGNLRQEIVEEFNPQGQLQLRTVREFNAAGILINEQVTGYF